MHRKIITTADGSKTIQIEEWNEQYHSIHGAIQEANHVFIGQGLFFCLDRKLGNGNTAKTAGTRSIPDDISILEIGFGTGLNAFLTLLKAAEHQCNIRYVGIEAYPVTSGEIAELDYANQLNIPVKDVLFKEMHAIPWEVDLQLTPHFTLKKQKMLFKDITAQNEFDLIYFDAFGARVQPELWTQYIFQLMFDALRGDGVLVTYAAKGSVRRALLAVGFKVEKLPGPPGKREMLRAIKTM